MASVSTFTTNFSHPILSDSELTTGCRLGFDSWADTSCAGKHAYVASFVDGKSISATGFSSSLGSLKDLRIANVVYAYDTVDGEVLLLENNNAIYMGELMEDSLLNPIQMEEHDVRVDLRPLRYYPSMLETCQCIQFRDGTNIPIQYDGVLPFITVRRPTPIELDTCRRLQLTGSDDWNPTDYNGFFSRMTSDDNHGFPLQELTYEPIGFTLLHHADLSALWNDSHIQPLEDDFENNSSTIVNVNSSTSSSVNPIDLSRKWKIGLATARRTLSATTQKCIRTTGLLSRRLRTDKTQLKYNQLSRRYGRFYVDFLKVGVKSIRGYIGGTVYTNKLGFKKFFPCDNERGITTAATLKSFVDLIGLPYSMHSDNHSNFREGAFRKLSRKLGLRQTFTEPHSPWQNRAENAIGEIKRYARRIMRDTSTPVRLWCFAYEYSADLLSIMANGRYDLHGRTPYESVMHHTPDISEYLVFAWFDWCYSYDPVSKNKVLGRWLGPAFDVGQSFCSYVLTETGKVVSRSSLALVLDDELNSTTFRTSATNFMASVNEAIGNHKESMFNDKLPLSIYFDPFGDNYDDDDTQLPYGDEIHNATPAEIDEPYLDALDNYIGTQVVIPGSTEGIEPVVAVIKHRKRDQMGNPIGTPHSNPLLDSRIYCLEFPDGRVEEYGMNVIVENLMSNVDQDGWDTGLFKEVIGFRRDPTIAIPVGDEAFTIVNNRKKPVITTKGWEVQVLWNDTSTSWLPLSMVKESHPVQVAEYAVAHGYSQQPAFRWWVNTVLRKRNRLISKVKTRRQRKGNMKFGVIVPTTVEEALALDKANGNTLWADAIAKEMQNNKVAFQLLALDERPPPGFKKIRCHMNFEVKIDLRRKARYVAGGHLTDPPSSMTYSTVVSRESVRIAFLIAALNGLNVLAGDIQNAYLNAPTTEKLYFTAGKEWGADEGKIVVIVRALYGLKSSALNWRTHLSDVIANELGFKSSLADPDVWMKACIKPDGEKYYAYLLVYVDDILIIDIDPMQHMQRLKDSFNVRDDTIKEPDKYLGADISKVSFQDGTYAWSMSSESYTKAAIKNVKARLKESGFEYNKKLSDRKYSAKQPFSSVNYKPELDTSAECNDEQVNFYQNLIGVLRWIVELGRIDIAYETALLSKYLAAPRTGHLNQALHIFKYIDIHSSNEITFDPDEYTISTGEMAKAEQKINAMQSLYKDAIEETPPNAPEPRGKPVQINCFVDSDHAGDLVTRRSHTGLLIYLNKAPIIWYSKKQSTIESSTFGSEFVALRIATEQIISLRYKLRMFGVPVQGFANVFCDNESVFKNASIAESRLTKKHNSICFHRVREAVASRILLPFKVDSKYNLSDILTKSLPPNKRIEMRRMIMPDHNK